MIFAIDFDGTYAEDPDTFRELVDVLTEAGHTCILATQRCVKMGQEVLDTVPKGMEIVWASGRSKREACRDAGFLVDVWVDDNPYGILQPLVYNGCEDDED